VCHADGWPAETSAAVAARRHLLLLDNATSSYTYDLEFAEYVNRYILYSWP